jgi:hypothetical protein
MCAYKAVGLISNSNTPEADRPQHDRPAACVIAQQYSSATFVSLRFISRKEKFGSCLNSNCNSFFTF